mmetsp:Transcript_5592/g.8817  ORF Transcript_5592/g.8817 Transcript_5592/m.8817 type:complete len:87 (+) Transcript_5592:558-818(+)
MCVPDDQCNTRFSYKSFRAQISCGWFQVLIAKLGGFILLIVAFLLIGLCICCKYIAWRRNENLKVENYMLKQEIKREKQLKRAVKK